MPASDLVRRVGVAGVGLVGWKTAFGQRAVARLKPLVRAPLERPGFAAVAVLLTVLFWAVQSAVMAALVDLFGVSPTPSLMLGLMGLIFAVYPMMIGIGTSVKKELGQEIKELKTEIEALHNSLKSA